MKPFKCLFKVQCLLVMFLVTDSAKAATYNFNLSGDASAPHLFLDTTLNSFSETFDLINAPTGLNQLPGFTLSLGDTVSGIVQLNSSLTVPSGFAHQNILDRLLGTGAASNVYFDSAFTFYAGG